ncbi:MAG: hypothetical protein FJZ15_05175, partial [Candidatus Omnitrophica bacterium]|nr:hypothetical protein [Candidatus Omnitrophota bacterium]
MKLKAQRNNTEYSGFQSAGRNQQYTVSGRRSYSGPLFLRRPPAMRLMILAILVVLISGCISVHNPISGKTEYYMFDDKAEIAWGDDAAKQIKAQKKMVTDPTLTEPLQKMGEEIAAKSHRNYLQYHFYIIDDAAINACALPGGHIFVNSGLLEKLDEDQVAFVLAHEIGHVNARHGLKRIEAQMGFNLLALGLAIGTKNQGAVDLANQVYDLLSKGYSREDEFLADSLGLQYAHNAGYDKTASLDVFDIFHREEKSSGAQMVPVYLRTHPTPADRMNNAKAKIEELKVDGQIDFSKD